MDIQEVIVEAIKSHTTKIGAIRASLKDHLKSGESVGVLKSGHVIIRTQRYRDGQNRDPSAVAAALSKALNDAGHHHKLVDSGYKYINNDVFGSTGPASIAGRPHNWATFEFSN